MPFRVVSNHGGELLLLALVVLVVGALLGVGVMRGLVESGLDYAAFLLVLQRIVEAVQKRWEQRGVDRLGEMVGQSQPSGPVDAHITNSPSDPVRTMNQEELP